MLLMVQVVLQVMAAQSLRSFTSAEVAAMLENDDNGKQVDEAEFEEESADEEDFDGGTCSGDSYVGDDGTDVVLPSHLLLPEVRASLSKSA